jgi:hypothetical protein
MWDHHAFPVGKRSGLGMCACFLRFQPQTFSRSQWIRNSPSFSGYARLFEWASRNFVGFRPRQNSREANRGVTLGVTSVARLCVPLFLEETRADQV